MKLKDLKPGDVFTRHKEGYKYVVTDKVTKRDSINDEIYCHNLDGESAGYTHPGSEDVIIVYSATTSNCKPEPDNYHCKGFWMCFVPSTRGPIRQHFSFEEAEAEAERLARTTGSRVYLLYTHSSVTYTPPTNADISWERSQ